MSNKNEQKTRTILIAGSRDYYPIPLIRHHVKVLKKQYEEIRIISGGAKGVDECAEEVAKQLDIPFRKCPANWEKHGIKAGPIRNQYMAKQADIALFYWRKGSRGTKNCITATLRNGCDIHVYQTQE
jgi:hypothetical protein